MTLERTAWIGAGGFVIVLPLILLELVYAETVFSQFPIVLFAFLWVLSTAFIALILAIIKNIRRRQPGLRPLPLMLQFAATIAVAVFWGVTVVDQMPCFLGVPNCD